MGMRRGAVYRGQRHDAGQQHPDRLPIPKFEAKSMHSRVDGRTGQGPRAQPACFLDPVTPTA